MGQSIMLRLTHINLSHIGLVENFYEYARMTSLHLVDKVRDVSFLFFLWNISPPTRHEVDIFDMQFLPFELEVAVNHDEESI